MSEYGPSCPKQFRIRRSCPKSSEVQTAKAGNDVELSEGKRSSDSPSQKSRGSVRSQAKFGQTKPEMMRCCPKSSEVRTAQARNDRGCPNQTKFGQPKPEMMRICPKSSEVRTTHARNHAELSEVKRSSDNTCQKSRGAVRSQAKFGQHTPEMMRSCPKSSEVRTAQARNDAELSKGK
ncbi:hypothetical protein [Neobacillus cucumis]|uniref:hypothetical protein n=1 Tax=Neobacillus cucumis TaxID=1740721 RepID=UPI0019645085|nr:hypothetical protein [Neobacillus cucumis]MBM7654647.1 hypothetical protein [Neobacillus cucumis]